MKERLVLVATVKPWNLERALEEIGDALLAYDSEMRIEVDRRSHSALYVHSKVLAPRRAFKLVVAEPPAYIERVVPVDTLLATVSPNNWAAMVAEAVSRATTRRHVWVEVKHRNYFVVLKEKEARRLLTSTLRSRGFVVDRGAELVIKVEDTPYGVALALLEGRVDRLSYWRRRRLSA